MNKENQHFVPKAFLKNFCQDRKAEIYESRFIKYRSEWANPKIKNINSICYYENLYDVSPDFAERHGTSPDFVERNGFWYEKGFLDEIIQEVENETIKIDTIKKLPDFYLSMIARNPVFMNGFNPLQIKKLLDKELTLSDKESEWVIKMAKLKSTDELDEWREKLRTKFLEEHTQQKMYSTSIYKQHSGQSKIFNEIRNKIACYKVIIGRIKDDSQFFITSDSPGFSMCQNGKIYSLKFKDDAFHYMPISSQIVIILLHPIYAFEAPKFSLTNITNETLTFINRGTIKASKEYIYCESKEYLSDVVSNWNRK